MTIDPQRYLGYAGGLLGSVGAQPQTTQVAPADAACRTAWSLTAREVGAVLGPLLRLVRGPEWYCDYDAAQDALYAMKRGERQDPLATHENLVDNAWPEILERVAYPGQRIEFTGFETTVPPETLKPGALAAGVGSVGDSLAGTGKEVAVVKYWITAEDIADAFGVIAGFVADPVPTSASPPAAPVATFPARAMRARSPNDFRVGLVERDYDGCGASHDRDVNSAINILRLGRSASPRGDESRGNTRGCSHV